MKLLPLIFLLLCGCDRAVHIDAPTDLAHFVGQRVELVGTVTGTTVPQIHGVDLWGLEGFVGQTLRVSGILVRSEVKTTGDHGRVLDTGTDSFIYPALRPNGVYYRLQDSKYEKQPSPCPGVSTIGR